MSQLSPITAKKKAKYPKQTYLWVIIIFLVVQNSFQILKLDLENHQKYIKDKYVGKMKFSLNKQPIEDLKLSNVTFQPMKNTAVVSKAISEELSTFNLTLLKETFSQIQIWIYLFVFCLIWLGICIYQHCFMVIKQRGGKQMGDRDTNELIKYFLLFLAFVAMIISLIYCSFSLHRQMQHNHKNFDMIIDEFIVGGVSDFKETQLEDIFTWQVYDKHIIDVSEAEKEHREKGNFSKYFSTKTYLEQTLKPQFIEKDLSQLKAFLNTNFTSHIITQPPIFKQEASALKADYEMIYLIKNESMDAYGGQTKDYQKTTYFKHFITQNEEDLKALQEQLIPAVDKLQKAQFFNQSLKTLDQNWINQQREFAILWGFFSRNGKEIIDYTLESINKIYVPLKPLIVITIMLILICTILTGLIIICQLRQVQFLILILWIPIIVFSMIYCYYSIRVDSTGILLVTGCQDIREKLIFSNQNDLTVAQLRGMPRKVTPLKLELDQFTDKRLQNFIDIIKQCRGPTKKVFYDYFKDQEKQRLNLRQVFNESFYETVDTLTKQRVQPSDSVSLLQELFDGYQSKDNDKNDKSDKSDKNENGNQQSQGIHLALSTGSTATDQNQPQSTVSSSGTPVASEAISKQNYKTQLVQLKDYSGTLQTFTTQLQHTKDIKIPFTQDNIDKLNFNNSYQDQMNILNFFSDSNNTKNVLLKSKGTPNYTEQYQQVKDFQGCSEIQDIWIKVPQDCPSGYQAFQDNTKTPLGKLESHRTCLSLNDTSAEAIKERYFNNNLLRTNCPKINYQAGNQQNFDQFIYDFSSKLVANFKESKDQFITQEAKFSQIVKDQFQKTAVEINQLNKAINIQNKNIRALIDPLTEFNKATECSFIDSAFTQVFDSFCIQEEKMLSDYNQIFTVLPFMLCILAVVLSCLACNYYDALGGNGRDRKVRNAGYEDFEDDNDNDPFFQQEERFSDQIKESEISEYHY